MPLPGGAETRRRQDPAGPLEGVQGAGEGTCDAPLPACTPGHVLGAPRCRPPVHLTRSARVPLRAVDAREDVGETGWTRLGREAPCPSSAGRCIPPGRKGRLAGAARPGAEAVLSAASSGAAGSAFTSPGPGGGRLKAWTFILVLIHHFSLFQKKKAVEDEVSKVDFTSVEVRVALWSEGNVGLPHEAPSRACLREIRPDPSVTVTIRTWR